MSKQIINRVVSAGLLPWKRFKFLQSTKFKAISKREKEELRASIKLNNFVETFKVWRNGKTGTIYCLDGYHRCMVLRELEQEGYDIPEKFICEQVSCKDESEAALLMLIYSSRYAQLTVKGVQEHLDKYDLDITDTGIYAGLDNNLNRILEEIREGLDASEEPEFVPPSTPAVATSETPQSKSSSEGDSLKLLALYFSTSEYDKLIYYTEILKKRYNINDISKIVLESLRESVKNSVRLKKSTSKVVDKS